MNPGYFFPANLHTIPTNTSVLEAQNRIAQATFTDQGFVAAGLGHPSYDEMIYTAITALKEGNGSSEKAIAKYIERVYSDLPLSHETLLAHQLKRLKDSGQIVMVKKSYKLPESDTPHAASNPASQPIRRGRPPKLKPIPSTQPVLVSLGLVDEAPALSSEKKRPGLPPKSGTQPEHSNPASQPGRRGRPPKLKPIPSTQPVLVSLGLVDEASALSSEKKGPGLPPKSGTEPEHSNPVSQPEHSNPASQPGRRGRPPKLKPIPSTQLVLVSLGLVDEAPALSSEKKGPGLPPKSGTQPEQGGTVLGKRGRGRPPGSKDMKLGPKGVKKGPGRPPKGQTHLVVNPYASDTIPPTTIGAESVAKRRGRPKKVATATATAAAARAPPSAVNEGSDTVNPGGVKKAVGRPRKNAPAAGNGVQLQDLNTVGYGELKRKFDFFQAQVKAAVDVIKPYISNATSLSVLKAIQELDGLALMDVSVPLIDQTQTKS